jgi:hypothetical protein
LEFSGTLTVKSPSEIFVDISFRVVIGCEIDFAVKTEKILTAIAVTMLIIIML